MIMGTAFSPFPTIVGVTFQGTNAVESTVNVVNGMTLNGGVITLGNGPSGIVSFSNTSAISGSGQILFASGNVSSITQNAASVLTIGTNISVRATGTNGRIGATGRGWINQGTISAEGSNTITFLGTFTNSGSILASTNARIVAGSGYTQLAGQTLINGTMTGSTVTVRGGTIGGAGTIYNPIVFSGTSSGVNNSSGSLTLTNFAVSSGSTFTKSGDGILNLTGTQSHGANSQFVIDGGTVNLNSDAGKPPASPATANLSILLNAGAMNINAIQELKSLDVADNADPNTFINIGSGVMVNIYGNGTSDGQPPSRSTIEQVYQDLVSPHYGGPGIRMTPGTNPDPSYSQLTLGRYTDGFGETALALMEDIVGDVDLDGIVTTADLAILLHNLNVDPASRGVNFFVSFEGDLDFDGLVTTNDLALLLHHLNQTFTPSVGGSFGEITPSLDPTALSLLSSAGFDPGQFGLFISPVPEPGSIGLLSLAAVMLRRPRRKLPHRSPATNG
jgi:hypothetical protein